MVLEKCLVHLKTRLSIYVALAKTVLENLVCIGGKIQEIRILLLKRTITQWTILGILLQVLFRWNYMTIAKMNFLPSL